MCKKCDKLWGTPTDFCYAKADHNVVDCSSEATNESTEKHLSDDFEEPKFEDSILQKNNKIPPVVLIHVF